MKRQKCKIKFILIARFFAMICILLANSLNSGLANSLGTSEDYQIFLPLVLVEEYPISYVKNLITSSRVIEGFDSTDGFITSGGTLEVNTTQFLTETGALQYTPATGSSFFTTKTIDEDFSADKWIRLSIYQHDYNLEFVTLQLSSEPELTKYMEYIYWPSDMNAVKPCWTTIQLRLSSFTAVSGEDWNNQFIRMKIIVTAKDGKDTGVTIDNLSIVDTIPGIVIMFDDGGNTDYSVAYPILKSFEQVATSYINSQFIDGGGYMTSAQLQELDINGWDIGNHGVQHDYSNIIGFRRFVVDCQAFLDRLGLTRASKHVAYPYGKYDAEVIATLADLGMLTGRTIEYGHRTVFPIDDVYQIQSDVVKSSITLAEAKGWVDRSIANGEVSFLLFHDIVDEPADYQWSITNFEELMAYIRYDRGVQTFTISEWYALNSGSISVFHR